MWMLTHSRAHISLSASSKPRLYLYPGFQVNGTEFIFTFPFPYLELLPPEVMYLGLTLCSIFICPILVYT